MGAFAKVFIAVCLYVISSHNVALDQSTNVAAKQVPVSKGVITMKEYNNVKIGMTYEQAVKIIGDKGKKTTPMTYSFKGDGTAVAVLSVKNNKVFDKTEIGLR